MLSNDLHLYISTFLDHIENANFGLCCIRFYQELFIKFLRRFHFKQEYCNYETYFRKFTKYIILPEYQLHLTFTKSQRHPSLPFPKVYSLSSEYSDFQKHLFHQIEKIHSLELYTLSISEGPGLIFPEDYGLKRLHISKFCVGETRFPVNLPVSLECLEVLGFSTFLPTSFSDVLSHLHELTLSYIPTLSDVGLLVNIRKLRLKYCKSVVNITPLQTTEDIVIIGCSIVDYRNCLTYSRRIDITYDQDIIIDISCFKAVQSLMIRNVDPDSVPNEFPLTLKRLTIDKTPTLFSPESPPLLSKISYLQELTISGSLNVDQVSLLGCIPMVTLKNSWITSLNGLGYDEDPSKNLRNKKVTLESLLKVVDFTPLNTIQTVIISRCDEFRDFGQVKDVKDLSIRHCHNAKMKPSTQMMNEKFSMIGKLDDNLFIHLSNVRELDIRHAEGVGGNNLKGLEICKNLRRVALPPSWKEQETPGWEMLKHDYSKFYSNRVAVTYLKKSHE